MSLINCPECNKEISNKAKICPNCGIKINSKSIKNINKKVSSIITLISIIIIGSVLIFKILISKNEENQYKYLIEAHETITEKYGSNISLIDGYYLYIDPSEHNEINELAYDFEKGRYAFFNYDMNPDEIKNANGFVVFEGELLFDKDKIKKDDFNEINKKLYDTYFQESLALLMLVEKESDIDKINGKKEGKWKIDMKILKKYIE